MHDTSDNNDDTSFASTDGGELLILSMCISSSVKTKLLPKHTKCNFPFPSFCYIQRRYILNLVTLYLQHKFTNWDNRRISTHHTVPLQFHWKKFCVGTCKLRLQSFVGIQVLLNQFYILHCNLDIITFRLRL